ncbi:AraC family transcriptional regulator [Taibaiella koreensis]|uniref:AraC family transcriptional regulator n=1 Tax=Taibaiella koreensis TaxID=1268548 RepID=UPI000E59E2EC|nr:AraC family transcriptional regulator [Taibaiella koreensis]
MPLSLLPYLRDVPVAGGLVERFQPSTELAAVIDRFYFVPAGAWAGPTMAFSDGIPTLVFTMTGNQVIFSVAGNTFRPGPAWLNSPYLEQSLMWQQRKEALLIVRFRPAHGYHLFGAVAPGTGDRHCRELPAALGQAGVALLRKVQQHDTPAGKIAAIEAFCLAQCIKDTKHNAMLERAIALVGQYGGNIRVQELALKLKVTCKWLERNFLVNLGLSPKEYIRQQRFLLACLSLSEKTDIAALAQEHGYYDQSHFAKDFKRFTGKAPLQYLKVAGKAHD